MPATTMLETDDELISRARQRIEAGREFEPETELRRGTIGASGRADVTGRVWPVLDPAALHGLLGEIVEAIAPHTEGDPVAILINTMVMFGNAVGRSPHVVVGASRHGTNENAVLVGKTSRARKGTAHDEAYRLVSLADPDWTERVAGGISSGEGIIHAVRDATFRLNKDGQTVPDDPGVADKRLMAVEPEFASVLKVARREGNTSTEVQRRAWDGNDLQVLTRSNPLRATRPHISILGHVTEEELRRTLDDTSQTNGYFNRYLVVCVRRSQKLPNGGSLPDAEVQRLAARLQRAIEMARKRGRIHRTPAAEDRWTVAYDELTADRPGIFGAITARAEAHALRLSLLYALLDGEAVIDVPHLKAALCMWKYCEDSARYLFGDAVGDPVADRVLIALRRVSGGMTQTALGDLFGKNLRSGELASALERLLSHGLVQSEAQVTGGRPAMIWRAIR
ncbi:MAG: DUF3987 domain-containing protein [Thermomicrobiales bacterium]